jgi:SAM-dependent methyltransferase
VDSAPTLVAYARRADPDGTYLIADAACLPLRDGCSDLVIAYNSLQGVPDMFGTVREAARILSPAGRFCLCVSHPITDIGKFDGQEEDAPFVVRDDYFARRRVDDMVERDGLVVTFRGWTYSIQDYVCALEEAGLMIESLREPRPVDTNPRLRRWGRIPIFLMIKSIKAE